MRPPRSKLLFRPCRGYSTLLAIPVVLCMYRLLRVRKILDRAGTCAVHILRSFPTLRRDVRRTCDRSRFTRLCQETRRRRTAWQPSRQHRYCCSCCCDSPVERRHAKSKFNITLHTYLTRTRVSHHRIHFALLNYCPCFRFSL